MEDTKRLRSKLRLDLNDVGRQIEELEELMQTDKSSENIEAHKKLVEYEQKLKEQYEKMTGITIDQAKTLKEEKKKPSTTKESWLSVISGMIAGILFASGFFSVATRGIRGYQPQELIDFYLNGKNKLDTLDQISNQLGSTPESYYVIFPLIATLLFYLINALTTKLGNKTIRFVLFAIYAGLLDYFIYLTQIPEKPEYLSSSLENNIMIMGIVFASIGLIGLVAIFDNANKLFKLFMLINSVLIIYGGALMILIGLKTSGISNQILFDWPWLFLPMIIAGISQTLAYLFNRF